MAASAFLAALAPAHGFVTNNKTVTTLIQDAPDAYIKGLTAKGNPHLVWDSSEVGSDRSFLAPNLDLNSHPWTIALQYYYTEDVKSISSITFAVGTFDQGNNTWLSSSTDIGYNVKFTATINVTVGGQLVDNKITGGDHMEVGVLTGYLYKEDEPHMGSGSEKIMVTLTTADGSALDLEKYYQMQPETDWVLNYCVHITSSLEGTSGASKLGIGFGSISYENTMDGYIWRGTSTSHTWGDQSKIWTAVDLEGKETPEQIFQAGSNALFDGGGNELVTLYQTVAANNVYIKNGSYIFDIQAAEPLSANGVVTLENEKTELTVQGSGRIKASYLAGKGTLAKDGDNTSTVQVSGSAEDFHGNITLNYGAELSQNDMDIFIPGVLPGETYDLLTVPGNLALTDAEGRIIDAKTLDDGYDASKLFKNITAGYFDLRYRSTGDNVGTFYLYTVVPEPATGTLCLFALGGLCARRRRK